MLFLEALAGWLVIVAVSAFVVALLARRWGHDPFGWVLLSAVMGPIVIVGLVGATLGERGRPNPRTEWRAAREKSATFRILAACDGSRYGALIAQRIVDHHRDADVMILAVLPKESEPGTDERARMDSDARVAEMTKEPLAILERAGMAASISVAYGAPGEEIVRCAAEERPDLVMVGRRGAGLTTLLLGSVSDYVVRSTARPVLVVTAD